MLLIRSWLATVLVHSYVAGVQPTSDGVIQSLEEEIFHPTVNFVPEDNFKQLLDVISIQSKRINSQQGFIDAQAKLIATLHEMQFSQASIIEKLAENVIVLTDKQVSQHTDLIEQSKEIKEIRAKQGLLEVTVRERRKPAKLYKNRIKHHTGAGTSTRLSKRILLHSSTDILSLVTAHSNEIKSLQADVLKLEALQKNMSVQINQDQTFKDELSNHSSEIQSLHRDVEKLQAGIEEESSGSTYIRWGRKSCPSVNGTELVYSGFAAGSHYTETGAASNYICLSPDPNWEHYNDSHDAYGAHVYGAEYQSDGIDNMAKFLGQNVQDEDVPCSLCRSSRPTVVMIPGKNQCYKGWTLEYKGYLSAGNFNHAAASEFVCLDIRPDVLQGGHSDKNGVLFYLAEGRCGSLPCPPYVEGRELTCVVCSR